MPARSMTWATARWPISRYGVCARCSSASIIEFSKWVRRHQVTNALGSPLQPLAFRNGAAIATSPPCMSTTVPYWSNMQTLTVFLMSSWLTAMTLHDFLRADPRRERIQYLVHHLAIVAGRTLRHVEGVIGSVDNMQRRKAAKPGNDRPKQVQFRELVGAALQEQHWDVYVCKMRRAL